MKIFSNIWNCFLILENEFQILENEFQILENTDFCPHWLAIHCIVNIGERARGRGSVGPVRTDITAWG